jgi:hypothetical protein
MNPLYLHYALLLELEREREREKLQRRSKFGELLWRIGKNKPGRKIAHRFGTLMILWGSKLQGINTASPTDIIVDTKLSR